MRMPRVWGQRTPTVWTQYGPGLDALHTECKYSEPGLRDGLARRLHRSPYEDLFKSNRANLTRMILCRCRAQCRPHSLSSSNCISIYSYITTRSFFSRSRSLVPKHFRGLVRLLKILHLFLRELDVHRICPSHQQPIAIASERGGTHRGSPGGSRAGSCRRWAR